MKQKTKNSPSQSRRSREVSFAQKPRWYAGFSLPFRKGWGFKSRLIRGWASILCTMLLTPLLFLGEGMGVRCVANNLTLGSTITIVDASKISFTIKWDNSWFVTSAPNNWDAVWVFVKYKDCTTANWLHAPLSTTGTDHTVSGGGALLSVEMPAVNDGNGVFIRRTAAGSGTPASAETVTLTLGIATGSYNFKVFGIEMVKILQESFQVGDGASTGTFNGTALTITSEGALTAANLGGAPAAVALSDNTTGTGFPKGYNAFYCMKYEITQEQYVDFLNTLTYAQQAYHTAVAPNIMATNWAMGPNAATVGRSRNGIKIMTSGVASTTPAVYACDLNNNGTVGGANYNDASDGQNIPCNYLSWDALAAYLDWACLRPMTELEFEKACRGIIGRVSGEYIWGALGITQAKVQPLFTGCTALLYTNYGQSSEASTASGNGLATYGYTGYPVFSCATVSTCDNASGVGGGFRVGFAATGTTDRVTAAATYYGAMEMGGNLSEPTIQTNATGSVFTGVLGNGALDASGGCNVANWPAAPGAILRGGDWYNAASYLQTSTRNQGNASASRTCTQGGRGVR